MSFPRLQNPLPTISDGNANVSASSAVLDTSKQIQENISAIGSSSGTLFTSQKLVSFIIRGSQIGELRQMSIKLIITNNNVASMCLVNLPHLFSQLKWECGGASWMSYPEEIMQHYEMEGFVKSKVHETYDNVSSVTYESSATIIAPGATETFYLDIPSVFTQASIPLCELQQDLKLTFYTRSGTAIFDSTSLHSVAADVSIDMTNMYLVGKQYSANALAKVRSKVAEGYYVNGFTVERTIKGLGALASGTTKSENLSSFNGFYHSFVPYLRAEGATQELLYQYDNTGGTVPNDLWRMTDITLKDQSGSPYYGVISTDDNFQRFVLEKERVLSLYPTVMAYYPQVFCPNPKQVALYLEGIGVQELDDTWRFDFTTVNTGGANTELVILGYQWVRFGILKGQWIWLPQGKQ